MTFIIHTNEMYHLVYQVEAPSVEAALELISGPDGTRYVRPDVSTEPAHIKVTNIESVIRPKEAA